MLGPGADRSPSDMSCGSMWTQGVTAAFRPSSGIVVFIRSSCDTLAVLCPDGAPLSVRKRTLRRWMSHRYCACRAGHHDLLRATHANNARPRAAETTDAAKIPALALSISS